MGDGAPGSEFMLETPRLLLRPWRVTEAVIQREMWLERDPRVVPPHRRIEADGHPSAVDGRFADGVSRRVRLLRRLLVEASGPRRLP